MQVGYNKAFIPKSFFSFQLFHANNRLLVFTQTASGVWLISFMRLDYTKDIQSIKSAWSILHFFFFLGFTSCKAEQLLRGMEFQEKEAQKG